MWVHVCAYTFTNILAIGHLIAIRCGVTETVSYLILPFIMLGQRKHCVTLWHCGGTNMLPMYNYINDYDRSVWLYWSIVVFTGDLQNVCKCKYSMANICSTIIWLLIDVSIFVHFMQQNTPINRDWLINYLLWIQLCLFQICLLN